MHSTVTFMLLACALGGLVDARPGCSLQTPDAPVARPIDAHELVGAWRGEGGSVDGVELIFDAAGSGRFGAAQLTWTSPRRGALVYTLEGETTRARYSLTGERLVVRADGEAHVFLRAPARPVVQGFVVPPPIEGAATGATTRLGHSRGYYTFEAPSNWTLGREDEDGLWVNPGLAANGTLDALIRVSHGELEPEDRGAAPTALVARYTPDLVASLREIGITLEPAAAKPRAALVGEVPGALQEWRGKQRDGVAVRVWLAGIVKRDHYLTITAVLVESRAEAFVPGLVRMFTTLVPSPPERDKALEAILAGRQFKKSESFGSSGSSYSTYRFDAGGGAHKEFIMGGRVGLDYDVSGSTEEHGRYEVVGGLVYLYFRDGQMTAELAMEGETLKGLLIGGTLHRAR